MGRDGFTVPTTLRATRRAVVAASGGCGFFLLGICNPEPSGCPAES